MRSNGREPLRTSQLAPNRVSLHTGERPQVACPICGSWRWLKRGMLRPHRADDGITRCPGSAQPIVVDETPRQWRTRLCKAMEAQAVGRAYVMTRTSLSPVHRPNGRARLHTSTVDPRRMRLTEPDSCQLACPMCGRWRNLQTLPGVSDEKHVGAHRADDGITRCPGSGQRVVVDETLQQWRARVEHAHHDAARVAPAVAALQQHRLDLEIELPDCPAPRRAELANV